MSVRREMSANGYPVMIGNVAHVYDRYWLIVDVFGGITLVALDQSGVKRQAPGCEFDIVAYNAKEFSKDDGFGTAFLGLPDKSA